MIKLIIKKNLINNFYNITDLERQLKDKNIIITSYIRHILEIKSDLTEDRDALFNLVFYCSINDMGEFKGLIIDIDKQFSSSTKYIKESLYPQIAHIHINSKSSKKAQKELITKILIELNDYIIYLKNNTFFYKA